MKRIWLALLMVALVVGVAGVSPASAAQVPLQGTYTGTVTVAGWSQVRDQQGNLVWCPSTVTIGGTLTEQYLGTGTFVISFNICAPPGAPSSFNLITPQGTIAPQDASIVQPDGTTVTLTGNAGWGGTDE